MNIEVVLEGKPLQVYVTRAAEVVLAERTSPLIVEMELYFSCLIRKRVRFHSQAGKGLLYPVNANLSINFHPVMTEQCSLDSRCEGEIPKAEFPITNPAAFLPRWLRLDYEKGEWLGEFGYT